MKEKIEKDANVAKVRGRVLVTTAVIALGFGIIYSISIFTGGAFHEFCTGAIQWVMLGVGTACALTLLNIKNSDVE